MRIRPIALCLGVVVTPSLAPSVHAQYDVTVLQDVGGQGVNRVEAINNAGQSVGFSATPSKADDTSEAVL
jgi:hypothetical protein